MPNLFNAMQQRRALAQFIRDALGDDEQAIADTIEGMDGDVENAIAAAIRESRVKKSLSEGMAPLMEEMKRRAERYRYRSEKLLAAALQAAQECGITKIEVADFTANVGKSQGKVIIVDEAALPQDCFRPKYEINRALIRDRLLTGVEVPGAELSNPEAHWTVRTT